MSHPLPDREPHVRELLALMERFAARSIDAAAFKDAFMRRWEKRRDEIWGAVERWPDRPDLALIAEVEAGRISRDDFGRRYRALFGKNERDAAIDDALDACYSACDSFTHDEEQLRSSVATLLGEARGA